MINCAGQRSWRIKARGIEAFVTQLGGHLAPVYFDLGKKKIQPFEIAPWAREKLPAGTDAVLKPMRGDFFCMPFGGNTRAYRGKKYAPHGQTAGDSWSFKKADQTDAASALTLQMKLRRGGQVEKQIELRSGDSAVYQRHTISGVSGPMPLGHHPVIQFPDEPGAGFISTSRFVLGQVYPQPVESPEQRGYSALKPGATFSSLAEVPTIFGTSADLSRYPARRGYEDIVLLASDRTLPFAWTAAAFPKQGYVFFTLKNPRVLASTLFWISNGGRHYAPWDGRHVNVMGMEEITGYFHAGIAESARKNTLSDQGIPTVCKLSTRKPYVVNFVMGVAPISKRFTHVTDIVAKEKGIKLISASGDEAYAQVDLDHLQLQ